MADDTKMGLAGEPFNPEVTDGSPDGGGGGRGPVVGAFLFSILVGIVFVALPMYYTGIWYVLSTTRVLDLLMRAGIVAYHDKQPGLIEGVEHKYYFMSQQPVDWPLFFIAVGMILLMVGIKALQLHTVARFYGIQGTMGQHARAYLYGFGLDRFMPYDIGQMGSVAALVGQGAQPQRALAAVSVVELFTVFEIVAFALIGLVMVGWGSWLVSIFWALVILGITYLIVRPVRPQGGLLWGPGALRAAGAAIRHLAQRPGVLAKLCLLSFLAFGALELGAYLVMMSFHHPNVWIAVEHQRLVMGLVGGYIARLIPITPGGIGQFELGCSLALHLGGAGLGAIVAMLVNFIRLVGGLLALGVVLLWYGVPTNVRSLLDDFAGAGVTPEPRPHVDLAPEPTPATDVLTPQRV